MGDVKIQQKWTDQVSGTGYFFVLGFNIIDWFNAELINAIKVQPSGTIEINTVNNFTPPWPILPDFWADPHYNLA